MHQSENFSFKSHLLRITTYLSNLLKFKLLKTLIKLGILFGIVWLISGNWLGDKLIALLKSSSSGFFNILTYVILSFKGLAVASLIISLVRVIMGKPIARLLFYFVGLGLVALLFEHFFIP